MRQQRKNERGAVLLGVLVTVAAMAALATATLGDISNAMQRGSAVREAEQAFWYATGVEQMTATVLRRSRFANHGRDTAADSFLRGPMRFPIEGGFIEARISDGGNCFNLNSLVVGEPGGTLTADPRAGARFVRLLRHLGIDESHARGFAGAATDWIDSDLRPEPRGAEDAAYAGGETPMRTAGTLMAEVGEFRALAGVDAATHELVRPFLCALPTTAAAVLNINTLEAAKAPLLLMLAEDSTSEAAARAAIEDRPREGYKSVAEFLDRPALRGRVNKDAERALLGIETRYYELEATVAYRESRLELRALFEARGEDVRHIGRSFGQGA